MYYACKIIVHSPEIFGTFLLTNFISKTFLLPANPIPFQQRKVTNHKVPLWGKKNLPSNVLLAASNSRFFVPPAVTTTNLWVSLGGVSFRFVETESLVKESQVAHLLTPKLRWSRWGPWESWEIRTMDLLGLPIFVTWNVALKNRRNPNHHQGTNCYLSIFRVGYSNGNKVLMVDPVDGTLRKYPHPF